MSTPGLPSALIIGGQTNALSIARSLGNKGVTVRVTAPSKCIAFKSKYCDKSYPIPTGQDEHDFWFNLLIGQPADELQGSVIMAGSDSAIEFISKQKEMLSKKYILDDFVPEIHLAMLDKQKTLEWGKKHGCPIPEFWNIDTISDIESIPSNILYPVMIKPIHSHLFRKHFRGKKYFLANDENELLEKTTLALDKNLEVMVTEMIPGPDDFQTSYHTYIDDQGTSLFHYTHKVIRRYPKNSGAGCLHSTNWFPETAQLGQQFFAGINYRGMGHVEFKYDQRDNKLKIIECNPRFSAAQETATKSGLDMPYIIYCHMVGCPIPADRTYRYNVKRILVLTDIRAARQLFRLGELTLINWLRSIPGSNFTFAYFKLSDPVPFLFKAYSDFVASFKRRVS